MKLMFIDYFSIYCRVFLSALVSAQDDEVMRNHGGDAQHIPNMTRQIFKDKGK